MPTPDPEHVEHIAARLRHTLDRLVGEGMEPSLVLAVAHAEAVAIMAANLGGDVAAQVCEQAAERVRHLPPAPGAELAGMPCAGRA